MAPAELGATVVAEVVVMVGAAVAGRGGRLALEVRPPIGGGDDEVVMVGGTGCWRRGSVPEAGCCC